MILLLSNVASKLATLLKKTGLRRGSMRSCNNQTAICFAAQAKIPLDVFLA
jgi:hypothetical protein